MSVLDQLLELTTKRVHEQDKIIGSFGDPTITVEFLRLLKEEIKKIVDDYEHGK